jgi:hypothetical protein
MTTAEIEKRLTAVEKELAELRARIKQSVGGPHAWVERIAGSFSAPEDQAAYTEALRLGRLQDKRPRPKSRKQRPASNK